MARQVKDIQGIAEMLCMSTHQIYKLVRRRDNPIPHRKIGKSLRFDVDRVWRWFDSLPGADGEGLNF